MKKIILTIDDTGNLIDDTGIIVLYNFTGQIFTYTDFELSGKIEVAPKDPINVEVMIALAKFKPDEILKLREAGIL